MSGANIHNWSVKYKEDIHLKCKVHGNSYKKCDSCFTLFISFLYQDQNKKCPLTKVEHSFAPTVLQHLLIYGINKLAIK